jgi:hypothetical protein
MKDPLRENFDRPEDIETRRGDGLAQRGRYDRNCIEVRSGHRNQDVTRLYPLPRASRRIRSGNGSKISDLLAATINRADIDVGNSFFGGLRLHHLGNGNLAKGCARPP